MPASCPCLYDLVRPRFSLTVLVLHKGRRTWWSSRLLSAVSCARVNRPVEEEKPQKSRHVTLCASAQDLLKQRFCRGTGGGKRSVRPGCRILLPQESCAGSPACSMASHGLFSDVSMGRCGCRAGSGTVCARRHKLPESTVCKVWYRRLQINDICKRH